MHVLFSALPATGICQTHRATNSPSSHCTPQSALNLLPPFYRSVMFSWFRLSRRAEAGSIVIDGQGQSTGRLDALSASFVYQQFAALDRTENRCIIKYQSWGLDVHWNTVWCNLHLPKWLIAHGILPTADRLNRFHMAVDPLCHCGQSETLVHLFTSCPVASRVFTWYQSLVHRVLPSLPCPSASQLLVGYPATVKLLPVYPCLLGITCHYLWVAGNRSRFDSNPRDVWSHSGQRQILSSVHSMHSTPPLPQTPVLGVVAGKQCLSLHVERGHHCVPKELW